MERRGRRVRDARSRQPQRLGARRPPARRRAAPAPRRQRAPHGRRRCGLGVSCRGRRRARLPRDLRGNPGRAASVQALRAAIRRAATDHAPVFIVGETGAGKERVARELHRLSGRTGALVSINCAALAPSLVESQLFGHSRGAFTGALEAQRGLFRDAHGGSLLLDEIGELPTALQAKLLRAIQEREVHPLGGADPVTVDVRVIATPAEHSATTLPAEPLLASSSSSGHPRPPLPPDAPTTPSLGHPRPPLPSRDEFVAAFEQLGGSVRALARHFGRERRQIYRWIEAHGVRG